MNAFYMISSLFALGISSGLYLLSLVLRKKETPKFVSFVHGLFVLTALGLLIYYATRHSPGPIESVVLFIIAAFGGLTLIYRDITGNSMPRWLAIGHGSVAVLGFIFLIVYAFNN